MKKIILFCILALTFVSSAFANSQEAISEIKSIFPEGLTIGEDGCKVLVEYNSDSNGPLVNLTVTSDDQSREVAFTLWNSTAKYEKMAIESDSSLLKIEASYLINGAIQSYQLIFDKLVKTLYVIHNDNFSSCQLNY